MRLLWALAALLSAAAASAPLRGVVRCGGLPVPGAKVTATQGARIEATSSGGDGGYAFAALAPGAWRVRVAMTGFVSAAQTVEIGAQPAALNFELAIAPYTGPPAAATPAAAPGFARTELQGAAGARSQPPPAAAAAPPPGFSPRDANNTAANALAVNGSVDNAAASPFGLPPAFGNHRVGAGSLYNGGFGLLFDTSALDARSFSLTGQDTAKPAYNDLTGFAQIGGPLLVPHLLNANAAPMVFLGYEKSGNRNAVATPALVPTAAERAGDLSAFAQPIVDPATGQPFPNRRIPISPQAQALLALYPLPNLAGGQRFNYQAPLVTNQHQDALQMRVNQGFSQKNQVAGSFNLQSIRSDSPNLFGFLDTHTSLGLNADLTYRHGFTPYLYGTFGFAYSRMAIATTPYFARRENVSGLAGIAGNDPAPANWGPPTLAFASGLAGLGDAEALRNRNQTAAFRFDGYWNHYDHNLYWGGEVRRLQFNDWQQQNGRGTFRFNGAASGNDFADFLLGIPDAASLALGNPDKYFRETDYALYLADDWRVSDSLSLDWGVRWEYAAPITELYGRLVNLELAPGFTAAAPVEASAPVGRLSGTRYPSSLLRPDRGGFEPRLGLAWTPFAASSVVLRAGYGITRDTSVYQGIALQMAQQAPLSKSLSVANTAATPLTLARGFLTPPGATPDLFAVDPNFRIGYAQTWNASLQRDLPGGMEMTLAYLGTKGTHGAQRSLPNTYPPGGANPCPSCPVGFVYMSSNGNSTYESGQAGLVRRFHNGFAATASYTYAHALDDAALGGRGQGQAVVAQNWLALDAERARSNFDQRHRLTLTTQYSTGVGMGGGALLGGWRGAAYQGWTITTQLSLGSGLPLTPQTALVVPGTGMTGIRPDATGLPANAPPPGLHLNPAAFAPPAAGSWGTAGRNSLDGPGQFSLDAALQRSFQVSSRVTANLRLDASNVLNHVAYPSWNTLVGSAQFGLPLGANPMRSLQTTLRFEF
ncbi:MAG TPA: carboxypeptidase regulatory-like domain-containing protein [Terriglobales bacterium]|nr:carboxypeptidase regulatory-like domain-containing protein [Terriglobales bacterium]